MYNFTSETILRACNNLSNCPAQVGGIISVRSILESPVKPLITYSLNNRNLKLKLSHVFDNIPKTDFPEAEPKYIVFSNDWEKHFFDSIIKEKIDLLSISVFFLRRNFFTTKLTAGEIIEKFINENNISPKIIDTWFSKKLDFAIEYNVEDVEKNQKDFYLAKFKTNSFKSITFNSIIQKCAYEFSAAAHIQTLYSGNDIKKSFIYSDVSLSEYYNFQGRDHLFLGKKTFPRNRIIFGAPGTGKSHRLKTQADKYFSTSDIKFCRNINLEKIIKDEIKNKPASENNGDWAAYVAIKHSKYLNKLNSWFSSTKPGGAYTEFLNTTFDLLAKQPEIMISAYRGMNICMNTSIDANELCERVTFHPNYSYAQFVGAYKPITKNVGGKEEIAYEYVPGPLVRTFIKAKKSEQDVLLLIEEINRANVAAVFGDVFQLLDRDEYGNSEYPITTSEDLRKFLAKPENLGGVPEDYETISLPSNMYIWATMNSADQGVFPMDTAFKRRWEFEYIGIDDGELKEDGSKDETFEAYTIPIPKKHDINAKNVLEYSSVNWNEIRHAINDKLKEIPGVNEDKLLGPYFLSKTVLESATKASEPKEQGKYCSLFKSKVLMYLFEDVVKMQPSELFESKDNSNIQYSDICKEFDNNGLKVFVKSIYEQFKEFKDGDAE